MRAEGEEALARLRAVGEEQVTGLDCLICAIFWPRLSYMCYIRLGGALVRLEGEEALARLRTVGEEQVTEAS